MKNLAGGAAFVAVLILANVVGAGVFLVLWPLVKPITAGNDWAELVAAALLGAISVACAYFFLAGALAQIPRWMNRRP